MTRTVVVITGAAPLSARAVARVPADATLVAADGGLDHALAAGLEPTVLVGDLDSVTAASLAWAAEHTEVIRHPVDKAATDTELAVAHAASLDPDRLLRWPARATGSTTPSPPSARSARRRSPASPRSRRGGAATNCGSSTARPPGVSTTRGTTFSVLAMHGPCRGVTLDGARWPLHDHDLAPLVGLGVSNVVATNPVSVTVAHGILTVVVPGGTP